MIEIEKMGTYIFDLDLIKISTSNDIKINWFLIKNLYLLNISKDKETIITNTIINKKMLIDKEHFVIYRPEYFALNLENLNFLNLESNDGTHLEALLIGLIDIYVNSEINYPDIRMKWLINTLIHHKILINVFDPANKTTKNFKELFEI